MFRGLRERGTKQGKPASRPRLITLGYGEMEILGSCVYTPEDYGKSVGLLEEKRVALTPLVTHRLPLAEGIGAIERLTKGMSAQKVLLAVS